jgi:putative membrane protein
MMGYGNDMNGWDWLWASGMMVLGVVVLVLAVWAVVSLTRRDRIGESGNMTALGELDSRLARGEIDADEYTRRRDAMHPAGS